MRISNAGNNKDDRKKVMI